MTYSDGFIPEHKVTSEKHDNGLFRVGIRAKVQRRSLIMKLKAANITLKSLDGQSLYGSIVTQIGAEKDAAALVAKALEGFPDNYLEARVVGEPETLKKSDTEATLVINVELAPCQAAYKAFAARFCKTLEGSCRLKGEFTSVIPVTYTFIQPGEEYGWYNNLQSQAQHGMPGLRKTVGSPWQLIGNGMTIVVATLVSEDSSRVNWSYYLMDEAVGDAVLHFRGASGKLQAHAAGYGRSTYSCGTFRSAER